MTHFTFEFFSRQAFRRILSFVLFGMMLAYSESAHAQALEDRVTALENDLKALQSRFDQLVDGLAKKESLTPDTRQEPAAYDDVIEVLLPTSAKVRTKEQMLLASQSARGVPNFADGRQNGIRIFAIRSGGIFELMGFKNGDTIRSVNAVSMARNISISELLDLLQDTPSSVWIDRGGRNMKLEIRSPQDPA